MTKHKHRQIQQTKNFLPSVAPVQKTEPHVIQTKIFRQQLQRTRQDVGTWRRWLEQAENPFFPHRVEMQRGFIDTVLNGHVTACIEKRKSLTKRKKYNIVDANGDPIKTDLFEGNWFVDFLSYTIEAKMYGYSAITIGNIIGGKVTGTSIVRRANVSPDRENVTTHLLSTGGISFYDPEFVDWFVYVPTPTETGASPCGYGILYKVAIYEIFLRNLLGYNGDFVELFAQPYRVGKSTKREGPERDALEDAVKNMGSSGWAIIDPDDQIEFLETALGGTGYNGYDNLEKRCEQKISKLILGHADAMDSTPGKLGGGQGEENPVYEALENIETEDITFVENVINTLLLPRLKRIGVKVPEGKFKFENNKEVEETRRKVDASNKTTAEIAQIMKNGGLQMDPGYYEERTGIKTTLIVETPAPVGPDKSESKQMSQNIKNKLNLLYKERPIKL